MDQGGRAQLLSDDTCRNVITPALEYYRSKGQPLKKHNTAKQWKHAFFSEGGGSGLFELILFVTISQLIDFPFFITALRTSAFASQISPSVSLVHGCSLSHSGFMTTFSEPVSRFSSCVALSLNLCAFSCSTCVGACLRRSSTGKMTCAAQTVA
jgi:hypothetical protein